MTPFRDRIRDVIRKEAQPPYKYGHQPRLFALAQQVGAGLVYDEDVVFAATWLHDLGVFEGNRPSHLEALERWDHVGYAAERAVTLLQEAGFPPGKLALVCDVIREHQPGDTPSSLEATIVRDADILEQLGTIAVLRVAAKLGMDTRFVHFSDVVQALTLQVQELPGKLQLPQARMMAVPRQRSLEAFLSSLKAEVGNALE